MVRVGSDNVLNHWTNAIQGISIIIIIFVPLLRLHCIIINGIALY